MAIASLHNVTVLESSVLRESQSSSSSLSFNDDITRMTSTRASSILQMWRELEDECVVNNSRERARSLNVTDVIESDNGSVNETESRIESMEDNAESQSRVSDQSHDFGEVERERVRQVFQEWKNSGVAVTPRTPNGRSSRGQWLGENERERVRVVREWIQMTSQQRDACVGNVDENGGDIGSRIERVRDGEIVGGGNDGRGENSRREIRRLCGRQALLDLLGKKEQERRVELQSLEASRPVSSFAQRNRIQSLLRIRCFQYARSVESSRSTSAAESELGLLRQRQTVSGLREGFLSRVDSNTHVQATNPIDGPSDDNDDALREHPVQATSAIEVLACPSDHNGDDHGSSSADLIQLSESIAEDSDSQESVTQVQERIDHPLDTQIQQTASTVENQLLNPEETSTNDSGDFSDLEQSNEILLQQYDDDREEINDSDQSDNLESAVLEDVNGQDSSFQAEEWHQQDEDFEETQWEGTVVSSQWRHNDHVEPDRQFWTGDAEESSHGIPENEASVQNGDHEEDYWHENGSEETPRDWLGMPYNHEATSSGRLDMYYLSDDDNLHNLELRELLNRRRVSSLLHSGFRESLDQLIRSYVERQAQAPEGLEVDEMPPPPFASRDQLDDAEGSQQVAPPPPPPPAPLPPRQQVLHNANWFSHEHPHPGTEWETINDLRIDLARLQQRLNNMQRMLEACMDMQLELQRSVRQEVSAALNRSFNPSESVEYILPKDIFKWECVKKGICCVCSNSKIDALLYRCGHMCTCTKCANTLLQGNEKCPMCHAPVIEVIRAYFIQ